MNLNATRRGITRLVQGMITLMMVLAISFLPAKADVASAASRCGDGSAPDYGFSYDLQQPHWTVGGDDSVSQQAINDVDAILDQLNSDSIAQTMILILPQAQVGNRVNCAVHFLRYMQLGLPTGARKDNGFVFLIVVEPSAIDVHYGVGLGLPALTASDLTTLNRTAEDTYASSQSIDQALLALVQGFDDVARKKYAPLTTTKTDNPSQTPAGPLDILSICGQLCFGILILFLLIFVRPFLARRGININPTGFGAGGWGGRWGGGGGSSGGGGFGGGRGGSGSGRSGRGN